MIPYLEEQCVGYRLLRRPNDDTIVIIQVAKDPIGQIAQALLDATAQTLEYPTPAGESILIDLRQRDRSSLGATRPITPTLRDGPGAGYSRCSRPAGVDGRPVPHALLCSSTRREELFTFARTPEEVSDRDHALKMLQRVVDIKADVKLIVSLRTEYYGRLLDHLRAGRRDFSGVRDELLRDFSLAALIAAIERPTSRDADRPGASRRPARSTDSGSPRGSPPRSPKMA